ncbi:hypothetical protein [Georgenia sunbinii]
MDPRLFGIDAAAYIRATSAARRHPARSYRRPRRRSTPEEQ